MNDTMTNVTPEEVSVEETEVVTNEETTKTESFNPQDYSVIRDMIKEMESWNQMLKDETHSILKNNYGLTNFAVVGIIPYTDAKIEAMTLEEIKTFMSNHRDQSITHVPEIETLEEGIKTMKEIKELQMNLFAAEQESSKLKAQSQDILNDYFEYLSSPEVMAARKNRLDKMKELAEAEKDPLQKSKMLKMIDSMEQADTMEFIFKRIYEDAVRESRIITEQFFDERRGNYIIERFKKRIGKFGFEENLYKYFFNLEETFLDEKYHAFNNLFLFNYMRFIAYADPYNKTDKLYVQSLTSAIANMIYHKFESTHAEQRFVHVIEKFLDYFMDRYEYFMINNTTRPGHPVREQASAKYEADQRLRLITKMNELGITGYDENMPVKELHKFFNDEMDKMLEAQKKERDTKAASKVAENEDGSVTIAPATDDIKTEFVTGTQVVSADGEPTDVDTISTTTATASTEVIEDNE